jgi:hypothetical protein
MTCIEVLSPLETGCFHDPTIPHCIRSQALIRRSTMKRTAVSLLPGFLNWPRIAMYGSVCVIVLLLAGVPDGMLRASPSINPAQIPAFLADKGKNLTALKAVMSVKSTYDAGRTRQDLKGFLLYRRPSDFRFQGVGPGGNSLFELVIKSGSFQLYVPAERKLIRGGTACFGRRFPDVAEIESLIPLALLQWKDARFDRLIANDQENTVIHFQFGGRTWAATLQTTTLLLKRLVRLTPSAKIDLTADFGGFSSGEYGWLPRRFEVKSPVGQWRTSVRIDKMETNPFLVETNFQLQPAFSPKIEECR